MGNFHIKEIALLKGWAMLLVLLVHSILVYPINLVDSFAGCKILQNYILSFHMQLLFIVSGYLYAIGTSKKYTFLIKDKFFRLLQPYLIFSLLVAITKYLFSQLVNRQIIPTEELKDIVLYGGEYWFLYVLFLIFVTFPLVEKIMQSKVIIVSLFIVWLLYLSLNIDIQIFAVSSIIYYGFFFFVGNIIARYKAHLKQLIQWGNNPYVFLCILILFVLVCHIPERTNFYTTIMWPIIGSAMSYGLIIRIKSKILQNILNKVSEYSLQIYLLDGFALALVRYFFIKICNIQDPVVLVFSIFIAKAVIIIAFLEYVVARFKFFKGLFGIRDNTHITINS